MNSMRTKRIKKSSKSPSTSFSSLPYDVVLNCLARISRFHRPILSLVSKGFRSLIASPELDATRALIGITEECLYVCLDLINQNQRNPRWFMLAPTPKQPKLVPIPSFPYVYFKSTVVSFGSDIYLIGGDTKKRKRKSSKSVFLLDCRSHQWTTLKNMHVGRHTPAAEVIDSKIYVTGGYKSKKSEDWGEVYDPKTQTWEPLSTTTVNKLNLNTTYNGLMMEIEKNFLCQISARHGRLMWRPAKEDLMWRYVKGLERLYSNPYLYVSLAANSGGRRVTVWWKKHCYSGPHYPRCKTTEICCAEISFQRCGLEELKGFVEWSKCMFTLNRCDSSGFLLHSVIVTH